MITEQNDLDVAASDQAAGLSVASPHPKTASGLSTTIPNAKERPILFSAPMVRAILDGSKTQTRRVVKMRHVAAWHNGVPSLFTSYPYGKPGDRLWVRETFTVVGYDEERDQILGKAGPPDEPWWGIRPAGKVSLFSEKWRPSLFMPRWASRINLEVVNVRVERLQDISEDDALAEGAGWETTGDTSRDLDRLARMTGITDHGSNLSTRRAHYALLWESINGPGSWNANPWVWAVEFRVRDSSENPSRSSGKIVANSPTGGSAPGTPKP